MIGKRFTFDERGGTFGRSPQNDMVMPDPNRYVSSRHGVLTYQDGAFAVYDQSSNGLFANGNDEAIGPGKALPLADGTSLKAGEYLLDVTLEEAAVPAPAADRPALRAVSSGSADAPDPRSAAEEVALDLALRLGLHGMSEQSLRQMPKAVTEVVRSCVAGVMDVLSSRRQVKHQLRVDTTVIQHSHNNALKVSASADEAIERMFNDSGEGYLPPETALLEAFQDIADHQVAMMAATRQLYEKMAERFEPAALERELLGNHKEGGLFGGKPKIWEAYCMHYQEIAQGGHASAQDDFVKEFSEVYTAQLDKLKRERSKPPS